MDYENTVSKKLQVSLKAFEEWLARKAADFTLAGLTKLDLTLISLPICMWKSKTGKAREYSKVFNEESVAQIVVALIKDWKIDMAPDMPVRWGSSTSYAVRIGKLKADYEPNLHGADKVHDLVDRDGWNFEESEHYHFESDPVFAYQLSNPARFNVLFMWNPQFVDGSGSTVDDHNLVTRDPTDCYARFLGNLAALTDKARVPTAIANNTAALRFYAQVRLFARHGPRHGPSELLHNRTQDDHSTSEEYFTLRYERLEKSMQCPIPQIDLATTFRMLSSAVQNQTQKTDIALLLHFATESDRMAEHRRVQPMHGIKNVLSARAEGVIQPLLGIRPILTRDAVLNCEPARNFLPLQVLCNIFPCIP